MMRVLLHLASEETRSEGLYHFCGYSLFSVCLEFLFSLLPLRIATLCPPFLGISFSPTSPFRLGSARMDIIYSVPLPLSPSLSSIPSSRVTHNRYDSGIPHLDLFLVFYFHVLFCSPQRLCSLINSFAILKYVHMLNCLSPLAPQLPGHGTELTTFLNSCVLAIWF